LIIQNIVKKTFSSIYFKIVTAFLILFYLSRLIDIDLLLTALRKVNYGYIPVVIIAIGIFWFANVISLYFLLLPIGELHFRKFFYYQLKSIVLGSVTPMQIGEATIFVYLKQIGIPVQKTLSAFLLNKLIHLVFMFLTGTVFLSYIRFPYLFIILLGTISVVVFAVASTHSQLRVLVRERLIKRYLPQYYDFFELLSDYLRKYRKYFFLNMLLNALKIIIAGGEIWVTFFLFRIHDNFWLLLSVFNLSRILTLIPVSIGGLGILEGGVALSLARLGFDYSVVILAMFFSRILGLVLALLALFGFLIVKPTEP